MYAIRPFRRLRCSDGRSKKLYALYASKSPLCTLCGNATPKKTAYNAYRNANRRVRRAEGLKMYALKDAYRLHTECIQVYKERKEGNSSFYFFLYCLSFYLLLLASSGNPQQTVNNFFTVCYCGQWAFSGFHRPSDGLSAIIPTHFLTYGHRALLRACTHFRPFYRLRRSDGRSEVVCIVCIKKPTMHAMREHNSEKDCIQCIQKRE